MNSLNEYDESIKLSLPVNAAYVSAARLTASSIANRMVFDIDEIEDIKAAVSEACIFIIKKIPADVNNEFTIVFNIKKNELKIAIEANLPLKVVLDEQEIGLVMIKALVDEFFISEDDTKNFNITMTKKHADISFD